MTEKDRKRSWEKFFDSHAAVYLDNCFTKNTEFEINFLIAELGLPEGSTILDIGCGTGRHSVGLAARGFKMTGVDLSTGMLAEAKRAAEKAGVSLELIHADATRVTFDTKFDAAICLCEGSFGLLGMTDDPLEHDLAILKNISAALKPGGKFILGALSGTKKAREYTNDDVASGKFDPFTLTEVCTMEYDTPEGKKSVEVRERGYIASEVKLMLRLAGLDTLHVWGGTAGNWRHGPLDLDEYELMFVAIKKKA